MNVDPLVNAITDLLSEGMDVASKLAKETSNAYEAELAALRDENARLRTALENIVRHQDTIAGQMSGMSATSLIAKRALDGSTDGGTEASTTQGESQ